MEQIIKKNTAEDIEKETGVEKELEEIRQTRKNWAPPEKSKEYATNKNDDLTLVTKLSDTPVKKRWNPVNSVRQDKTKSLEIPQKLNIENVFINDSRNDISDIKLSREKELDEIRVSRPTPLTKRWKPK